MARRLFIGRYVKSARGVFEPREREEDILGACRALLELNAARVYRAVERVPKCYRCGCWLGHSEAGTPDLSGYFYKRSLLPFWIEMKRPKGRHRPAQVSRIEQIQADGGIAFFADSVEAMVSEFKRFGVVVQGLQKEARHVDAVDAAAVGPVARRQKARRDVLPE